MKHQKLPIIATIKDSYLYFFEHFPRILSALKYPLLMVVFFDLAYPVYVLTTQSLTVPVEGMGAFGALLSFLKIGSWLLWVIIMLKIYRMILLDDWGVKNHGFAWTKRETKMLLAYIKLFLISLAIIIPFGLLAVYFTRSLEQSSMAGQPSVVAFLGLVVAMLAGFTALFYVLLRLILIFPAVAMDRDPTLNDAWEYGKGHVGAFFWITSLAFVPPLIVYMLLLYIAGEATGVGIEDIAAQAGAATTFNKYYVDAYYAVMSYPLTLFLTLYTTFLLSFIYGRLFEPPPEIQQKEEGGDTA